MLGCRVGQGGVRYFIVMVVHPDLSGCKKDVANQTLALPDAGGAHVDHAVEDNQHAAEQLKKYDPKQPLINCDILDSKGDSAKAIMKMIALMREELGQDMFTVHRMHSDKGQELFVPA